MADLRIIAKLREKKGASMVLVVCLFLVLCVLGINLLNVANANTVNTALEHEKEQTMLYISSVYELVNEMIEDGSFSDPVTGNLPEETKTSSGETFTDGNGKEIVVKIKFLQGTMPVEAQIEITCIDSAGNPDAYTVVTTYTRGGAPGTYIRASCKGLVDHAD